MDDPDKLLTSTLFIPCAGKGTRLAATGNLIPKPLITVDGKPAVAHIIDSYPQEWDVILAIGFEGEAIRNAVTAYFADSPRLKQITFVETDSYAHEGKGLSHTLLDAQDTLSDRPFVFHASDTILKSDSWSTSFLTNINQIVLAAARYPGRYRIVKPQPQGGSAWSHIEINPEHTTEPVYIGLAHVYSPEEFWNELAKNIVDSPEGGETLGLLPSGCSPIQLKDGDWIDTGSGLAFEDLEEWNSRTENILPKGNEALWFSPTSVTKFHIDPDFIKGRIERAQALFPFVPKITYVNTNAFTYKYVAGQTLSRSMESLKFDSKAMFVKLESFWFEEVKQPSVASEITASNYLAFYKTKTEKRIVELLIEEPNLGMPVIIDGIRVPGIDQQMAMIPWEELTAPLWGRVHGDFHPENIIESSDGTYTFLDWRQDVAGSQEAFGDVYYDLAKFAHGLRVDHGIVRRGLYSVMQQGESTVRLSLNRDVRKTKVYDELEEFVTSRGLSWRRVQLLEALIYLNIAPLHEPEMYRLLLGYLGRKLLHQTLTSK